ncbi:MAG: hypothetical protein JXP34_20240 [Planctomycetes bacterium]|nr:hypothetical protein [Planctomycetota bacterium]
MRAGCFKCLGTPIAGLLALAAPVPLAADTGVLLAGLVEVRYHVPDWIWQDQRVNVLLVLRSGSDAAETVDVDLELPEGPAFVPEDPADAGEGPRLSRHAEIPPGETVRLAFANIRARERDPATDEPLPRRAYEFLLRIRSGGKIVRQRFSVTTIRGALVRGGAGSVAVSAGLCLLWAIGLVAVLSRWSSPGAWKRVPVRETNP